MKTYFSTFFDYKANIVDNIYLLSRQKKNFFTSNVKIKELKNPKRNHFHGI